MLNKVEKLQKSLNFKKPKCIRETRTSNIDVPFNAIAQTFAKYIQYLKAQTISTFAFSLPITPIAILSTNFFIPEDVIKEIWNMLHQLANVVRLHLENPLVSQHIQL